MWSAADDHNYHVSQICRNIFRFKQVLTKYQIFTKLPQISRIHKNRHFASTLKCYGN